MDAHANRVVKKPSGSSFDITLEETLKALYERRLKVIRLLRSLEAQKREEPERKLKANEATY
jgi:hypothetical protein